MYMEGYSLMFISVWAFTEMKAKARHTKAFIAAFLGPSISLAQSSLPFFAFERNLNFNDSGTSYKTFFGI